MKIDFAFVTCEKYKDLIPDDRLLFNSLQEKGYECQAIVWDDPNLDWQTIRIAILRSAWDYHLKLAEFLNWIDTVSTKTTLVNNADLLRGNLNKLYLEQLSTKGFPIIPTIFLRHEEKTDLMSLAQNCHWNDIIVKPSVGLSSHDVMRISTNHNSMIEGQSHIDKLLAMGDVLVQPYLRSVEDYGERNLIFLHGKFSHCLRKMRFQAASNSEQPNDSLVEASSEELSLAEALVASIKPQPFYARVDLLKDAGNMSCLIELELIDPKLFFQFFPKAIEIFANGLIRLLERA